MKFFSSLIISLIVFQADLSAQTYFIEGKVTDAHTGMPVDSALIYIFERGYMDYEFLATDSTGFFRFDSLRTGKYNFEIFRENYKTSHKFIQITDSSVYTDIRLYHIDSSGTAYAEDIAFQDNFHGGFAVSFLNYYPEEAKDLFRSNFSIEYLYSFKRKITLHSQVGIDFIPLKIQHHNLRHDTLVTGEVYKKERYSSWYMGAMVYHRMFTKQKKTGFPGLFCDIGAGYEAPVLFRYVYHTDSSRVSIGGIHRYNEFTGLFRIGFDVISIRATYRFFDMLQKNYPEPPRIKIGLEINYPSRY